MKITKSNRVQIETTNMVNGCLEQGGVIGSVKSYDIADVIKLTGLTRDQIAQADGSEDVTGYDHISIISLIAHNLTGNVVRKGDLIQ